MLTPWDMPPDRMPTVDPEPEDRWAALDRSLAEYDWLLITLAIGLVIYAAAACWMGRAA